MESKIQSGYLLLADISGFDAYLAGVELEHAHGVLKELLELIVDCLRPPLNLANVKGDAVLAYVPATHMTRGESLLELIETTYVGFRDRVKSIHRNNTCQCRACTAVPSLDLKFMVHHGEYTVVPRKEGAELGGPDAILVRDRLLKDQMNANDVWQAYLLFTKQSLEQLGIQPEGMRTNSASYPHIGEIETATLNLRPRYEALTAARSAYVTQEEADVIITHDFDASPHLLWEWLNDPARRTRWVRWTTWQEGLRPGGRTDVGSLNHCAHGVGVLVETVLDWRPYNYFTSQWDERLGSLSLLMTYELQPLSNGSGTRLHLRTSLQEATLKRLIRGFVGWVISRKMKGDFEKMAQLMIADEAGGSLH